MAELIVIRRDAASALYLARIRHRGQIVGTVKRGRGSIDYVAWIGGLMVARGRTLGELRSDLADYFSERDTEENALRAGAAAANLYDGYPER